MEIFPITWHWLAYALIVLAINLVFPRSRALKALALIFLGAAICIHALLSFSPVLRAYHHSQRYGGEMFSDVILQVIAVGVFDVVLGVALGVAFYYLPVDVVPRCVQRWRHPSKPRSKGLTNR